MGARSQVSAAICDLPGTCVGALEYAFQRVLEIANGLINDHGVKPGESVGIAMRNYPEWVLAFWAIQMAGAVAVEHNSFWNGEELTYGVTDSGSRVMIVDSERHAAVVEAANPAHRLKLSPHISTTYISSDQLHCAGVSCLPSNVRETEVRIPTAE